MLTAGKLKEFLKDVPDDAIIVIGEQSIDNVEVRTGRVLKQKSLSGQSFVTFPKSPKQGIGKFFTDTIVLFSRNNWKL